LCLEEAEEAKGISNKKVNENPKQIKRRRKHKKKR
jgi:hypothetical protein